MCRRTLCTSVISPPFFRISTAVVCRREWAVNSFPSRPTSLSPSLQIPEIVRVVSLSPRFCLELEVKRGSPALTPFLESAKKEVKILLGDSLELAFSGALDKPETAEKEGVC